VFHVDMALAVLAKTALIAPAIAKLIKRYPDSFIYGAASPDIIMGKKYAGYFNHCHNWRMGWLILEEAENARQRAAAYGYLAHLAADVVGHNYYIPVKIVRSYGVRLLSHPYWEMRFDLGVSDEAWERLKGVDEGVVEEFDGLLERVLNQTLFSFSTNKLIFNTILILQKMRTLRSSFRLQAKHSKYDIGEENRQHYLDLTHESVFGFLKNPKKAPCLGVDPAGLSRLAYAKDLRRKMRTLIKRGRMSDTDACKLAELVKERLAVGLYRPDMQLPNVSKFVKSEV